MKTEEYDIGYFLNMKSVVEKTQKLIDQHKSIEKEDIQDSLRELIAIYYSKPFLSSKRAYEHENGWKHRIDADDIGFTEKERKLHDHTVEWRNDYVAHADQTKRKQEVEVKKNEENQKVGFRSVSSYEGLPLMDFQLDALSENLTKIKDYIFGRIYT